MCSGHPLSLECFANLPVLLSDRSIAYRVRVHVLMDACVTSQRYIVDICIDTHGLSEEYMQDLAQASIASMLVRQKRTSCMN